MNNKGIAVGKLIEESFGTVFNNISELMKVFGLIFIFTLTLSLTELFSFSEDPAVVMIIGIVTFIFAIASIFILPVLGGTMIKMLHDGYKKNKCNFKEAFTLAKERMWSLIGADLLVSLIFGIPSVIVIVISVLLIMGSIFTGEVGGLIGGIVLLFLFIIVVFFLSVFFSFYAVGIMLKGLTAGKSISYSFKMFKGRFGAIFGRLLLINLIVGAMSGVLAGVVLIPIAGTIILVAISVLVGSIGTAATVILVDAYDEDLQEKIEVESVTSGDDTQEINLSDL